MSTRTVWGACAGTSGCGAWSSSSPWEDFACAAVLDAGDGVCCSPAELSAVTAYVGGLTMLSSCRPRWTRLLCASACSPLAYGVWDPVARKLHFCQTFCDLMWAACYAGGEVYASAEALCAVQNGPSRNDPSTCLDAGPAAASGAAVVISVGGLYRPSPPMYHTSTLHYYTTILHYTNKLLHDQTTTQPRRRPSFPTLRRATHLPNNPTMLQHYPTTPLPPPPPAFSAHPCSGAPHHTTTLHHYTTSL